MGLSLDNFDLGGLLNSAGGALVDDWRADNIDTHQFVDEDPQPDIVDLRTGFTPGQVSSSALSPLQWAGLATAGGLLIVLIAMRLR